MSVSPRALQQQQQKPLIILQPTPTHYRPQRPLLRGARRATEPNKVPRPRNAFIIFRCLKIAQLHSKDASTSDRPPTPEKTLSKRAGAAWRLLPDEEKQIYKEMAEKERLQHQEKYPGYRYQPNRAKTNKPRTSGPLSRRERVESLVLRAATSHAAIHSSESDDSPSPVSESSSSPDPFEGSHDAGFLQDGSHRRSSSLPHLQMLNAHDPYPYARTYFIEPTSCLSSPGPGPHRTSRRSSLATSRSYSPSQSTVPPPECAFDLEYGNATVPFSSMAQHSSSLSLPELLTFSDCLALNDTDSSQGFTTPHTPPAPSPVESNSEFFPTQTQTESLFHRRQRSNTAPSAAPSPLAALSSSLGHWNGAVTATAAATAGLPAFTVTPAEDTSGTPTRSVMPMTTSSLTDGTVPYGEFFAQRRGSVDSASSSSSSSSLSVSESDVDMDRTPRRSDFPRGVQEHYGSHLATMSSASDYPSILGESSSIEIPGQPDYDLQSYVMGLDDLDISIPYDIGPLSQSMSPFEELDFSEFLNPGNY